MRKAEPPPPLSTRRRLGFQLAGVSLSFLALILLEAGLRLSGFGNSYPLFVQAERHPDYLRANPRVVRRFMVDEAETPKLRIRPVYFRPLKPERTIRIFVQGGSTAAGYPYGFGASPAGMLQQRLRRTFPGRKVEVVTTAVSAVNSYTLLDFADEIIEQQPDAVVIYAGHNEYVGILGVGSGFSVGRRRLVVLAFLRLRRLRLFQLLQGVVAGLSPAGSPQGRDRRRTLMATIAREKKIPYGSPLYHRGLRQYRANLRALLDRYREADIPVFLGTLVCNEADQPPFVSGHSPGVDVQAWQRHFEAGHRALEAGDPVSALNAFDAAVAIDDGHARGHYGRGRALQRLGRFREARRAYLAAKDRDQLRFRAPEAINRIIREEAMEYGARVVEVRKAFVEASDEGIVGNGLMLEHLHPNLDGYFVLADAFYQSLREGKMFAPWTNPISRETARREIPVTEVDRLYGEYRILKLKSDQPFSNRRGRTRIPPPVTPVERIAQRYYRGRLSWSDAMRELLDHYQSRGEYRKASKVSVLLAEAFPFDPSRQKAAGKTLLPLK